MKLLLIDIHSVLQTVLGMSPAVKAMESDALAAAVQENVVNNIADSKASHVAVCMEDLSRSYRRQLYPEYKLNSEHLSFAARTQLPLVISMLRSQGLACISSAGFEASDVAGTIARKTVGSISDVCIDIVSNDERALSMLWPGVRVLSTGNSGLICRDASWFESELGIDVSQLSGLISLSGSKNLNVPGLPGVHLHEAKMLLQSHGDLGSVLSYLRGSGGDLARYVENNGDWIANISTRMASLNCDLSLGVSLTELRLKTRVDSVVREVIKA